MSALSPAEALGMLTDMAAVRRDNENDALICNEILLAVLERARVVGVLDAWAGQSIQFAWEYMMAMSRGEWMCRLWKGSAIVRSFAGHSADAARAAAAKAIEAGEV